MKEYHYYYYQISTNLNKMQKQLLLLVKKFKNYDYDRQKYQQILLDTTNHNLQVKRQEAIQLNERLRQLQGIIQSLIMDGNRMSSYYQQILNSTNHQFDALKQELETKQQLHRQQMHQNKRQKQQLYKKIETLKQQLINKQGLLRDVSDKYQQLEQIATEVHMAQSSQIKKRQSQLIEQSKHLQDEINFSRKKISESQTYVAYLQQKSQSLTKQFGILKDENEYYIRQNRRLLQQIDSLKTKLSIQFQDKHILVNDLQDKELTQQEYKKGSQFAKNKINQEQEMFINNIILVNGYHQDVKSVLSQQKEYDSIIQASNYVQNNQEKQFLNISQHYYKSMIRNGSCEKSKFFEDDEQINIQKYNIRPQIQQLNTFILPQQQTLTKQAIIEPKEPSQSVQYDTYKSFFMLLTQSQKLNSPHFNKISTIDISHLYQQLINKAIPYNKWQSKIKLELEMKRKELKRSIKAFQIEGVKSKRK